MNGEISKKILVTTGLQDTWGSNEELVILGSWCIDDCTETALESRSYELIPSYLKNPKKVEELHEKVAALRLAFLKIITEELNYIHGEKNSIRYWEILIGPWLYSFISTISHRLQTLEPIIYRKDLSAIELAVNNQEMIPFDNTEFTRMQMTHEWNQYIYTKLLKYFDVDLIQAKKTIHFKKKKDDRRSYKYIMYQSVLSAINYFLNKAFGKNQKLFLHSTYFPIKYDLFLQIYHKQFPILWQKKSVNLSVNYSRNIRNKFLNDISNLNEDKRYQIIFSLIRDQIPYLYLEGYSHFKHFVSHLNYPALPKKIFTSSSYISDEIFKMYAANCVQAGSKYIVGINGGGYGISKIKNVAEVIGQNTSDRYLTWGWIDGLQKNYPTNFYKKTFTKKKFKKNGNLLIVACFDSDYLREPWDRVMISGDSYKKILLKFVKSLDKNIINKTFLRLNLHDNFETWEKLIFLNAPKIQIDKGRKSIGRLISKSRITVITYNSTAILECLNMNIPIVVYVDKEVFEPRSSALHQWLRLVEAKIVFDSIENMVAHLNYIWNDVSEWWWNETTQSAINEFTHFYCRKGDKKLEALLQALNLD